MELFTVGGIVLALVGILGGMLVEGGHPSALLSLPSFMIVMVGSFGALLIATPMDDVGNAVKSLKDVFLPPKYPFRETMEKIDEARLILAFTNQPTGG